MKKKLFIFAFVLVLLAGGYAAFMWYQDNRLSNFEGEAKVFVSDKTTSEDIIAQIKSQTSIKCEYRLRKTFRKMRVDEFRKPGCYLVKPSYSNVFTSRMLNNGWTAPVRVTLSGSLRKYSEISSKLGRQLMLDSATVASALQDRKFMEKYGFNPQTAFALFIPDTYEIWWNASVEDVFAKMRKAYDAFWTEDRKAKAAKRGLSPLQVSILASIVNSESNYTPEYPKIAGVYLNRLRKGMPLQACPTVAFVYDYKLNRILKEHLKVNSPYNTYTHAGLPPGPICSPSKAAIDAVLDADTESGYLYFCASPEFNGRHRFAKTYKQHMVNANAYQAEMDRRSREAKQ